MPTPCPTPVQGSACEGVALGLGASAGSDRSRSGAAPVAYRVTAVTPAIHPCTPRALVRTSYTWGRGRAGPTLTARAPQGRPRTPGAGEGLLWVTLFPTPQSDLLPFSSLECDRVRLGEGHLGLGCPYKTSSAHGASV